VGGASLSAFVIALAYPPPDPADALARAGFAIIGGLVAMAIGLVLWPLQPYRPARAAVAASYRALAAYTDDVARHVEAAGAPASELPAGSAAVRASLEESRDVLARARRGRSGVTGREERLVVLAEGVDQLFVHIVGVGEAVDSIAPEERSRDADAAVAMLLRAAAASARAIADATVAERDPSAVAIEWGGDIVRRAVSANPAMRDVARIHYDEAAAIVDRAGQFAGVAAVTVAALNSGRGEAALPREPVVEDINEHVSPLATIRAVLAPDSLLLRHALRLAVVATLAVGVAQALQMKRGYWLTITVIVILQPYTGATTHRALQRVIGTVLGGLLTAALGALFHDPRAILVLSFLFAAACVALLPVNYAAFSIFLTPTFVLLAESSAGDWHLAGTRVLLTLLGGALALVGSRVLWPSPERSRLPGYMAAALRANRDYLRSVVTHFADRSDAAGETIRAARRRIGLATVNAEESFQRLLGELEGPVTDISPVMTFLTYTRRLTASTAALALARHTTAPEETRIAPFAHRASDVLSDLADALENDRRPEPLPLLVSGGTERREEGGPALLQARLDRIARQIRLLHDAVERWTTQTRMGPAS
jgi:uncharacterized membrane protein YccC